MPLIRDRRTTFAVVLSVLIFVWCIGAAQSDTRRWVQNLHEGHQSINFESALDKLKARPGWEATDECNVCHDDRGWASNLIFSMAPVRQGTCLHCHRSAPIGAKDDGPMGLTSLGIPFLGKRLVRPAHAGVDLPGKVAGISLGERPRVECAACHPEHEGAASVDRIRLEERNRLRITKECLRCHVPSESSAEATAVLKDFVDAHKGDNAFEVKIPAAATRAITETPDGQKMAPSAQAAAVRDIIDTLTRQTFLEQTEGPEVQAVRGCTPACHGEHTVGTGDADDERYNPAAEGEGSQSHAAPVRAWKPLGG